MRKLLKYFSKESRLFIFIDIHAHSSSKGGFIYGNVFINLFIILIISYKKALESLVESVETHLYPKLVSFNSLHFNYGECDFSEK